VKSSETDSHHQVERSSCGPAAAAAATAAVGVGAKCGIVLDKLRIGYKQAMEVGSTVCTATTVIF
jgi:hypothetical protein